MRFRCLMFSSWMPMAFVTESWSVVATMPFHSKWLILWEKSFKSAVFCDRHSTDFKCSSVFFLAFCSCAFCIIISSPERKLYYAFFYKSIFSSILPSLLPNKKKSGRSFVKLRDFSHLLRAFDMECAFTLR